MIAREYKTTFNWKANAGSGDVLAWINTVCGTPKTARFAKHTLKLKFKKLKLHLFIITLNESNSKPMGFNGCN